VSRPSATCPPPIFCAAKSPPVSRSCPQGRRRGVARRCCTAPVFPPVQFLGSTFEHVHRFDRRLDSAGQQALAGLRAAVTGGGGSKMWRKSINALRGWLRKRGRRIWGYIGPGPGRLAQVRGLRGAGYRKGCIGVGKHSAPGEAACRVAVASAAMPAAHAKVVHRGTTTLYNLSRCRAEEVGDSPLFYCSPIEA